MTKKVVFITGASSGIGRATAVAAVQAGYYVVGTARRLERLQTLADEINIDESQQVFLPVACDVRDHVAVQKAVDAAIAHFGCLDVLVANAGIGHRGSLIDAEWNDLETLMRTNMDGVVHSVRAAVPPMQAQGSGHIILVSSVVYNMTAPYAAIYAASKAFVSSLGRSLRMELESDNILVTDMIVGRTASEFDQKRLGQGGRTSAGLSVMSADDVAGAIVKAIEKPRRAVAVRWIDRLIVLGNALVPDLIGRRSMRHYK